MRIEYAVVMLALIVAVGIGLAVTLGRPSPSPTPQSSTVIVGGEYLSYSLKTIDGGTITLADFQGKIVVIEFMRTTCPHCEHFLPTFKKFCHKYRDMGVVFISVSIEPTDVLQDYVKTRGIDWLVAQDPMGRLASALNIKGVPTIVILNRNGEIHSVLVGEQPLSELERKLQPLLQG